MYKFDAKKAKEELVKWMKDYFKDIPDEKLVVGISGGKDSTIVAAIGCEAIGKDRVIGVFMPNGTQYDIQDAYDVAEYLGIQTYEINIQGSVEHILSEMRAEKNSIAVTEQTKINLPPRIRTSSLFAIAQSFNGRVSCNCNLSEDWIGYSTYGGDDFGSFGPLRKLTVTELKQVGKELGLPDKFINKTPQDGLCGKTDEDSFGFTYEVLDKYIRTGEIEDQEIKNKIDLMHEKNLFKLRPMVSFSPSDDCLYETGIVGYVD